MCVSAFLSVLRMKGKGVFFGIFGIPLRVRDIANF